METSGACLSSRRFSASSSACSTGSTAFPHFHAEYQGQQASFTFDGEPLAGTLQSRTAMRLIKEWALAHGVELEANWNRVKGGQPLERIAPLD
jgi:hypothetical protein